MVDLVGAVSFLEEVLKFLVEGDKYPSLVSLQKKGNKKSATKDELKQARKRALQMKKPSEARAAAYDAWSLMRKKQIIQVYLDREAYLRNPKDPVPKPLFMDKKVVQWGKLSPEERNEGAEWLASSKTEDQLTSMLKSAESSGKISGSSKPRIDVYKKALRIWQQKHKEWKKQANSKRHF